MKDPNPDGRDAHQAASLRAKTPLGASGGVFSRGYITTANVAFITTLSDRQHPTLTGI
jgi:hypothetical protein